MSTDTYPQLPNDFDAVELAKDPKAEGPGALGVVSEHGDVVDGVFLARGLATERVPLFHANRVHHVVLRRRQGDGKDTRTSRVFVRAPGACGAVGGYRVVRRAGARGTACE